MRLVLHNVISSPGAFHKSRGLETERMEQLKLDLKQLVVEVLKLEDLSATQISDDEPLFREGLGLDSIDALELTVALEKRYQLSIPDEEVGKRVFASISTLAEFVAANRQDR